MYPLSASASSWYVDSQAGGTGNGSSWANAWKSLGAISWGNVNAGDTIYISGGTSSKSYAGGLNISKSGTAAGYITIDSGANSSQPSGHNGEAVIEGGEYCLYATGSYIKIRNLTCQHATSSGFRIDGTGNILENNKIREIYGQGIHIHYCTNCIARKNQITSFPNDGPGEDRPYQTDGIVAYESANTLIEQNWIRLTNQYQTAHIDGIQASTKLGTNYANITIQYNYVENQKNMASNSQGIYLTQMEGEVKIIGNVVNHPNGNQTVVSYLANNTGPAANVTVIGNTIKCGGYRCLLVGDDRPVIKNNAIWHTGTAQLIDLRDNTACSSADINNNFYYAPSTSIPFAGSCGRTWTDWHAKVDTNGQFGQNPNWDSCFRPTSSSGTVNKGTVLATAFAFGLPMGACGQNGASSFLPLALASRNSASWDIGAYIYSSATPAEATPTQPAAKAGDANGDGRVDDLDFVIWSKNYGLMNAIGPAQGDFNADKRVDDLDYLAWANNFGK